MYYDAVDRIAMPLLGSFCNAIKEEYRNRWLKREQEPVASFYLSFTWDWQIV
jgi:hypothetical protein